MIKRVACVPVVAFLLTIIPVSTSSAAWFGACSYKHCGVAAPCCQKQQCYTVMKSCPEVVYEPYQVTCYRNEYQTVYDEKVINCCKHVPETHYRECKYTVCRPVHETRYRTCSYTVCRPVWETKTKQICYTRPSKSSSGLISNGRYPPRRI